MIDAIDGMQVLDKLKAVNSPGSGIEHWGSSYFGPRYSTTWMGRFGIRTGRHGLEALVLQIPIDDDGDTRQ